MAAGVDREARGGRDLARARPQRLLLGRVQQRGERLRQLRAGEAADVVEHVVRDRLAAEFPDDRAQLRLLVEAQPVVDRVDIAVGAEQAVAALAVRVVSEEVEEADPLEPAVMRGVLVQREVVLLEVGLYEELERTLAVGPVTPDRERHQTPAERLGEIPGRQLALEEAAREIPERSLAALGLVHGQCGGAVERHLDEERRVRAPGHSPLQRHLAAAQEVGGLSGGRDRCSAGRRGRSGPWAGCTRGRWAGWPS